MRSKFIHYVASLEFKQGDEEFSGRTSGILEAEGPVTPPQVFKHIQATACKCMGVLDSHADLVVVETINYL
ncbi:hypothetical protein PSKM_gp62 [Pantoea phage vB_PagM_PSKM]|uniref:Uncharacterized protein n=1 Tax=Pantoea phage vB_PagM_PSKM TaxID=2588094 RepID=A0A513ZYP1_9CAUD|nr:hypothetical protein HWC23_gp62 [Pantoea phage vB_PagM_PSKM]QDH45819.1 hypothetical protein PSKM_gp62 [Pantoea phage vB_PagM_PSKM]